MPGIDKLISLLGPHLVVREIRIQVTVSAAQYYPNTFLLIWFESLEELTQVMFNRGQQAGR